VLTLDLLGISEEDWNQMPASARAALMFLIQQNQRLENRCATYELQVQKLQAELERLKKLELEVAELRERLGQNSQNSSKPPSSDPPSVSRPNKRQPSGRKRGGQRGHQGHGRTLLPPDQVDQIVELRPASCRQCGSLLLGVDPAPARRQISELPPARAQVTEYRQHCLDCLHCGASNRAEWPEEMPSGCFGPRAQAVIGYLTGRLGLSHRDVAEVMETLHGLEIGLGSVTAIQQQVSAALAQPVTTAQNFVMRESVHYVDETSWPESEKLKWLWIHATPEVTVFTIRPGRTKEAAQEILGRKFTGVVNTDRYNAYHWVDESRRQLCWAHLKREFQAIKERGGKSAEVGEGLLTEVGKLFERWYDLRGNRIDWPAFQAAMKSIEQRVGDLLRAGEQCDQEKTRRTCGNIIKLERSLWTFVRVEGIEPTNNNAERPLRRAVLWRRKSFGTQSESGSQFVERILTVVTTLRQQGRDALDYLTTVCGSVNRKSGSICLLPNSS
jgi:transposase